MLEKNYKIATRYILYVLRKWEGKTKIVGRKRKNLKFWYKV